MGKVKTNQVLKICFVAFVFLLAFNIGTQVVRSQVEYEKEITNNPVTNYLHENYGINSIEEHWANYTMPDYWKQDQTSTHKYGGTSTYQPLPIQSEIYPWWINVANVNPFVELSVFSISGLSFLCMLMIPKFGKKLLKKKWLIAIIIVAFVFYAGFMIGKTIAQSSARNIYFDDIPTIATYVINTDGTYYWATRYDGKIVYGGSGNAGGINGRDASTVIQSAISGLTAGRTRKERIIVVGEISIATTVELQSLMTLDLTNAIIKLTADTGVFSVTGNKTDIDIIGGIINGDNKNTSLTPLVNITISGVTYPQRVNIYNTQIKGSKDAGVCVDGLRNSVFSGLQCLLNKYGFKSIKSGTPTNQDLIFNACQFISNTHSGFYGQVLSNAQFNSCLFSTNTSHGLFADCSANSSFSKMILNGCTFKANNVGIQLGSSTYVSDYNIIEACLFRENVLYDINIPLLGSDYNLITGNVFYNTPYWGLNIVGSLNKLTDNVFPSGVLFADTFENLDSETILEGNLNLNPMGVLTAPYPTSTGNLLNVDQDQAYPSSNAIYTVKNTAKTIIIGGGTISQIAIDGVNTNLTSGVFRLSVGQTIKVTWSAQPTINQVRVE